MIKEDDMPDGELPRREWIDSGMILPPKREQIATWTFAALWAFPPKQWGMHGVTGTSVGFQKTQRRL